MCELLLSPREKQLLRRLAAGKPDRETAGRLGGTAEQVSALRAKLLSKLWISSETEITEAAKRWAGWANYKGIT